jgi:hypothetical protein
MKKLGLFLLPTIAITLLAGGSAFAQGDNSIYFVTYFSNAHTTGSADAVLRLINDGDASTAQSRGVPNGTLFASLYMFDDSQEMQECCNCSVSADGMLSESVNRNLMSNTLTGRLEMNRGVIKIISSTTNDPTNNVLRPGLRGTITHIQIGPNAVGKMRSFIAEAALADSNLSTVEKTDLEMTCGFVITLGSGYGTCSCSPEDQDF